MYLGHLEPVIFCRFWMEISAFLPNNWIPLDPNLLPGKNLNSLHARLVAIGPEDTEDLVGPQKTNDLRRGLLEQCNKKNVVVEGRLCYPVLWPPLLAQCILNHYSISRISIQQPVEWQVRVFFSFVTQREIAGFVEGKVMLLIFVGDQGLVQKGKVRLAAHIFMEVVVSNTYLFSPLSLGKWSNLTNIFLCVFGVGKFFLFSKTKIAMCKECVVVVFFLGGNHLRSNKKTS